MIEVPTVLNEAVLMSLINEQRGNLELNQLGWERIVIMEQNNNSWKILNTIPKLNDFEKSLELMTSEQIDLNIVQISLLALNNDNIMKWIVNAMATNQFYLKYRYVLEKVLNGKVTETTKKNQNIAIAKFDQKYVNGEDSPVFPTQKKLLKMPFRKERRLKFTCDRQRIFENLNELSTEIFKIQSDEDKKQYFGIRMGEINAILHQKQEEVSTDSEESEGEKAKSLKGFCFYMQKSLRKVSNINLEGSYFIKTKNRHPLVLDFQFGKFLYKNDDQLAHEIIAMELIKYINAILGKQYIVPYEILPECNGALYEFIQHSQTIHDIKNKETNGLVGHFQTLCDKNSTQEIMSKFAETYSGFCLVQFLLDIKDRNNANIMIRQDGSIFHIDLTFIFGSGPGGFSFESAPFKMTKEYVKVLGGFQSDYFRKFQALLVQHLTKISECFDELIWKLSILSARNKQIRCFQDFKINDFRKKIPFKLGKVRQTIEDLIEKSFDSWKTTKYDDYQFKKNGILF